MIFNTAHLQRGALDLIEDASEVRMQLLLQCRGEAGFAVFRAEHQVNQDAGQGLGHGGGWVVWLNYRGPTGRGN